MTIKAFQKIAIAAAFAVAAAPVAAMPLIAPGAEAPGVSSIEKAGHYYGHVVKKKYYGGGYVPVKKYTRYKCHYHYNSYGERWCHKHWY